MWTVIAIGVAAWAADSGAAVDGVTVRFADRIAAQGESQARLRQAYERLGAPPMDDREFVLADVSFQRTRRFTEYSGDISGRMLGALNAAGPLLGEESPMIPTLLAAFPKYQKADGHFGAEQDLARSVDQARDMPILWGNGRLLLAMVERYRSNPDAGLLAMARRLGEYMLSTRPYYGKRENFERVGGQYASGFTTCYPSLIDGLAALGEVTGDKRFLDEARFIARLSLLDTEFTKHHSHGRLTAYRGMLDIDRFAGTTEFLEAVRKGCRTITEGFILPTGGITEQFDRTDAHDEGCTEGDWIRVNLLLWQATGDPACLDAAEHCLRNHLLAMQFANGGFGHHVLRPIRDGDETHPGGVTNRATEAYWCCSMHGAQILADVVRWGVFADGAERFVVTWLAEARATWTGKDREITVTAEREEPNVWNVRAQSAKPAEVTVRLRVPGWAESISVNGETHRPKAGWVDLPVKLSGGAPTALLVHLPNAVRTTGVYGGPPRPGRALRVFAGADLYCLPDAYVGEGLVAPGTAPRIVPLAREPAGGEIPVVILGDGDRKQRAKLVRMSHRPPGGCSYLFVTPQIEGTTPDALAAAATPMPDPGTPIELCFACDGEFEVYLNGTLVHRGNGLGDARVATYTSRPSNVLAIKVRSTAKHPALIGVIRSGDRCIAATATTWSAVPCPAKPPHDWLTDPTKGSGQAAGLADHGKFGAPPWGHMQGEFAGTDARWVWPEATAEQAKGWWLLRCRFDIAR